MLYIEMGAGKGFLHVCSALVLAEHSKGNSHGLQMLPFAPGHGLLPCKSLDWSGEPCFFSTEKPGVQMQEISSHWRVFLFTLFLFSLWDLAELSLVEATKPDMPSFQLLEDLTH